MRRHVPVSVAPPDAERDLDLLAQLVGAGAVGLVDREDVGDLHDARLERLDAVARFGDEHEDGRVGHAGDVELRLADADRLDQDAVEAGGVEQVGHLARAGGEAAERAAAGHRADVDALVQRDGFHADAVAEQGAAGERAGRVHRDDADAKTGGAVGEDEALDQGGLAGARRAGDPDAAGAAERAVDPREQPLESRPAVLDHRDRPRQRGRLAGREVREQKIRIHGGKVARHRGRGKLTGGSCGPPASVRAASSASSTSPKQVVLADLVEQPRALQRDERLRVHVAQEHLGAVPPGPAHEVLERMHRGGVDGGHVAASG